MEDSADHNSYFDEAYFERGWERGTAYSDYSKYASSSKTFVEVAESIAYIFKPKRVLEIGCATGAIVHNLNEIGIEAHGIDVSEWAIDNRLDQRVQLAGADKLPFPDGFFDLVFSSHSLEHLPADIADAALAEMTRVCTHDGAQFHMLPIVGTHPYDCDEASARSMLQKDPTHNLLENMSWWLEKWGNWGWGKAPLSISYFADSGDAELSSGQYCLVRSDGPMIVERAAAWNALVHRRLFYERAETIKRASHPVPIALSLETFGATIAQRKSAWRDAAGSLIGSYDLKDAIIHLTVDLRSASPVLMRIALVDDSQPENRGVLEWWFEAPVGVWSLAVEPKNFTHLSGAPAWQHLSLFLLGGTLDNAVMRVAVSLKKPDGTVEQVI